MDQPGERPPCSGRECVEPAVVKVTIQHLHSNGYSTQALACGEHIQPLLEEMVKRIRELSPQ